MIDITTMEENNIFDVLEFLNKEGYNNERITFWRVREEMRIADIFGHLNTKNISHIQKGPYLFVWPRCNCDDANIISGILEPDYSVKLQNDEQVLIYPIPKVIES